MSYPVKALSSVFVVLACLYFVMLQSSYAFVRPPQKKAATNKASSSQGARLLTMEEYDFLMNLGKNVDNKGITRKIYEIIEELKLSPRLSEDNHKFLVDLAGKLNQPQASNGILLIARTHHPAAPIATGPTPNPANQAFSTPQEYDPLRQPGSAIDNVGERPQTLTMNEYDFLMKLSESVNNKGVTRKLYALIEALKLSPRLSQEHYDFLNDLAGKINQPSVAENLRAVANARKPVGTHTEL